MTREEFTKQFKEGDKIRLEVWKKGFFVQIKFFGEKKFFGVYHFGDEASWVIDHNWLPYEEEKPKDLEGVFAFVEVMKYGDDLWVVPHYGNKKHFEGLLCEESEQSEILTIEEAKQRGLDLSIFI